VKYLFSKITLLVSSNPKKPGTNAWRRFNLYRDGMTPDQFLNAGGKRSDLRNDEEKGYIRTTTLEAGPDAPTPGSGNRSAAVGRIRALLSKTVENGCTEQEAMAAAEKAGHLMDKYGIESSETELRDETCTQGVHGGNRARKHESYWCGVAVAAYCDCRIWHRIGTGMTVFFGFPQDVEVATYLMRVIEASMNSSYAVFKDTQFYNTKRNRNEFMLGFSGRVNARLREMRKARHPETLVTTTGTNLMVIKNAVVDEQFKATGMKLRAGKATHIKTSGNQSARDAGMAAGNSVHLGAALTGASAQKRLA
jgi:hypothetical protein